MDDMEIDMFDTLEGFPEVDDLEDTIEMDFNLEDTIDLSGVLEDTMCFGEAEDE